MKQQIISGINLFNSLLITMSGSLLLFACRHDHNGSIEQHYDVVYLQSNNFNANQNAVLAYIDSGSGKLEPMSGSPFLTGGKGNINLTQALGPEDSDNELVVSADGKYLLTVNSGSNTIAVFTIKANGMLVAVAGSPFPSGGKTPVSLSVSGDKIFVVNKAQDMESETDGVPNYTSFTIGGDGSLTPITGSTVNTTAGSSPSQIIISKDNKFAFGNDFLGFMLPSPVGTLRSFTVNASGVISPVAGTPYTIPSGPMPPDNGSLGLWQHPSGTPLYVGLPLQGKLGIYHVDGATGALSLQSTVAAGKAACWIRTNKTGDHLYVLNSGDNQVQVYNSANANAPISLQMLELKNSGPVYMNPAGVPFKTSEDFSLCLSSDEKTLYVVCQHTNTDFSIGNYNYLHALKVADDGKLTEPTEPVQLPVPSNIRPKGSLVVNR